ncbi:hypothetical protein [Thiolapillus sp.]|uniref:hypothetical protein n=1 Tax=Thiolapillus sp. TaxID=2017437 RepID=UPI003AF5FEBB
MADLPFRKPMVFATLYLGESSTACECGHAGVTLYQFNTLLTIQLPQYPSYFFPQQ